MALVALALSVFIAALGVLGLVAPRRLLTVAQSFQTPAGLYFAAALRLVFGVALLLAAPTSRAPGVVRLLGLLSLIAGLITPFFGVERFRRMLDWWAAQGPTFMRMWAGLALAFGAFIAYAVAP
jgi:hypothetical protein